MTICTRRLIAAAVLGSAVLVGGSAEALFGPADKNYTPSGDWDVGYQQSIGNNGICYAHSVYNNGNVQIWIGSRLNEEDNKQSWFLALYNKQWTWVKAGKTYHINLLPPDRKKVFWIDFEVVTHDDGLPFLVAGITKELANALALEKKKGAVGIFLGNGKFLNALELTNSAGAIREVVHCRRNTLATTTAHEQPSKGPDRGQTGGERYGTGFFVSPQYLLTNMHVIKGCSEVWVRYPDYKPEKAYAAGTDETNDLALLRTEMANNGIAAFRFGPRLGEASYAYGFPLPGLLSSSGNFTLGNVTALSGMNDDSRVLQTSTPVQPGNSGGPLLDEKAAVIGVVEKKLDAIMVASAIGDVPQNVNFAIQSPIVINFLSTKSVIPLVSKVDRKLEPADVADQAKKFTVQVNCK